MGAETHIWQKRILARARVLVLTKTAVALVSPSFYRSLIKSYFSFLLSRARRIVNNEINFTLLPPFFLSPAFFGGIYRHRASPQKYLFINLLHDLVKFYEFSFRVSPQSSIQRSNSCSFENLPVLIDSLKRRSYG